MKNSKMIVAMILVAGLVLGGCGAQKGQPTENNPIVGNKKEKTTLSNLLKGGVNQECQYSTAGDKTSVLVYVAGNKFYQEMTTGDENKTTIYAVSDGEWMYTWNTMQPDKGIKMNLKQLEEEGKDLAPTGGQVENQSINLNDEVEIDCKPWSVDNSKFQLPVGVSFVDFSAALPITTGGQPGGNEACKYCSMAGDAAAEAQCKQSLGCE